MTNPNLVNTSQIFMRSNIQLPISTSATDILETPAASNMIIRTDTVTICNTTAFDISIDVYITRSSVTYAISKSIVVPAYSSLVTLDKDYPVYLMEGDKIQVQASAFGLHAICSYIIISDTSITLPGRPEINEEPLSLLDANILLYASFDGTDGATAFDAYIGNGTTGSHILTSNTFTTGGGADLSTVQTTMSGANTSAYIPPTSNSQWVTSSTATAAINVGSSSPFSIQFWVYMTGSQETTFARLFSFGGRLDTGTGPEIETASSPPSYVFREYAGTDTDYRQLTSESLASNTWHHIYWALDPSGNSYLGLNGTVTSYSSYLSSIGPIDGNLHLGNYFGGSRALETFFQELIIRNDIPYTSNFTPSTTPLL